jgi:DNA (cytosine-5)-methyltransferase 1
MKYFSLFSGIGGFELGLQTAFSKRYSTVNQNDGNKVQSESNIRRGDRETEIVKSTPFIKGLEERQSNMVRSGNKSNGYTGQTPICVGFSEIDKYAIQIYKKHFPNHKEYGDVSNITWSDVEDFELLVGGFPCQSFSIAGKRRGFDDTRGTLFFEVARATQEKHPRLLLLENVKGLLSHDKGKTFGTILSTLDELGYNLQWQVLNSKNFGVPQNRERVYLIGHLRGTSRPEVFPLDGFGMGKTHPAVCLTQRGYRSQRNGTYVESNSQANRQGLQSQGDKSNGDNSIRRASPSNDMRIRRLTPTECQRLQGFLDGWTEGISDTQRYKCIGNAVTVNVIEAIVEKLLLTENSIMV